MVFKAEIRKKMEVPINATIGTFSVIVLCQGLTPIPILSDCLMSRADPNSYAPQGLSAFPCLSSKA